MKGRNHVLLLATLVGFLAVTHGQMQGSGRRQRDKEASHVKADLKLIKCDTCEMAMEQLFNSVEEKRAAAPLTTLTVKPGKKEKKTTFSEEDVNTALLEVCHRRKKGGEWLWYTDLVEASADKKPTGAGITVHRSLNKAERKSGERFLLVAETEEPGKWDHERATIKRSCEDLLDSVDLEDLVVALWRHDFADANELKKTVCKEMSRSCKGNTRVPLPVGRKRDDAPHDPQEKQLVETEQMMQNMEEAGSPMVMQSREDIEEEMREMAEEMGLSPEEMEEMMAAGGGGGGEEL
jgi:hypothetical protein